MLTVVLATHNGEKTLPRVLEAYCRLDPPAGGWKLLAVDNASEDRTREILLSFAGRLPLTYLFEARRGQNRARNAALSAVDGDLVVFTDDDAIPRRDWLTRMRSAADDHPEYSMFGGTILPRWEESPEDWIFQWVHLGICFALTDTACEEGPVRSDLVLSPNMAIRAAVFREGYRFDETFGPRGGSYAMGSETELMLRLARAGLRAWHAKSAVVEHIIRPFQMTPDWLLGRAVRLGRGEYRLSWRDAERLPRAVFGVPLYLFRPILVHAGYLGLAKLRANPAAIFRWRWFLRCSIGNALEARVVGRERRSR